MILTDAEVAEFVIGMRGQTVAECATLVRTVATMVELKVRLLDFACPKCHQMMVPTEGPTPVRPA